MNRANMLYRVEGFCVLYVIDVGFVCIELISVHCCFPDVICKVVRAVREGERERDKVLLS